MLWKGKNYFSYLEMLPGSQFILPMAQDYGNVYYVDSVNGSNSNSGKSWAKAFLTIAYAVSVVSAGDTIVLIGTTFSEAVTCTKAGIRFMGAGTGPVMTTWTAPTVAGSFCLKLSGANCSIENIKFRPVIYTTSGIPAAIRLTTGANYTKIKNCRFQGQPGSIAAIYADAAVDNVQILDNEFLYLNNVTTSPYGCGIYGTTTCASWIIRRNTFNSCRAAIIIAAHCFIIADNIIKYYGLRADNTYNTVLAMGIDLSAGYGCNTIANNQLGGAYSNSLYVKAATGDEWAGNWTLSTTGTITNGAGMTLTATA
jgi:hypothetical protein